MWILDFLTNWVTHLPIWIQAVTAVVTAATAITILTPSKVDDAFLAGLLKFLNALAGNIGKNKNADS